MKTILFTNFTTLQSNIQYYYFTYINNYIKKFTLFTNGKFGKGIMTHREKHNIESNCVSFNDDCYNEQDNYYDSLKAMNKTEEQFINKIIAFFRNLIRI